MKKGVSVLVVLVLTAAMLFACSKSASEADGAQGNPNDQSQKAADAPQASGSQQKDEPKKQGKFVFWDKSEYVKEYNDIMKQRVEAFGKANNIEVEYVVVPPNDIKTKLLAAIEAKNPPDLIVGDDFMAKQFVAMGQLAPVDDIVNQVDLLDGAKNFAVTQGKYFMVPQAFLMGGGYLRKDVWDKHNLPIPKTWQELYEQAKIVNDPKNGFYGVGLPLGASGGGDAEGMVRDVVLGFGGSFADKDNKVTINSPETLAALTFLAKFWQEGLSPAASVTWDDMGNNNAYLAGTVGFVINSGSIYSAAVKDKSELAKNTVLIPKLAGPKGNFILGGGNVFAIFKNGKNPEAAKKFVTDFYDKAFYTDLVAKMGGMWQPVLKGAADDAFWKDPNNKAAGWLDQINHVVGSGNYPGPEDDLGAKAKAMQLGTKAMQRIVVEKMDPQKSLDILEKNMKDLYGQN